MAASPLVLPVERGQVSHADLPDGSEWQVKVAIPGLWARPETLVISAPAERVQAIKLWPLAHVTGTIRMADKDARPPREIALATVVLPLPGKGRDLPVERVVCPLDAGGRFRCDFPAATLDLVVAAGGFVPLYRWGIRLAWDKTFDLGRLELRRGASVAGWAEIEGGALDPAACRARLVPLASGHDAGATMRLQSTEIQADVRKDGFFQLKGVPPGGYRLEVVQSGHAPAAFAPLQVHAGGETFVNRPLTLRPLLQLDLTIEPALDWLGQPWKVRLSRRPEVGSLLSSGSEIVREVDEQGRLTIPDQAPGRFSVEALDSLGNRFLSSSLVVERPEDSQQTLRLDLVIVRGNVRLGREPLPGTLWFGTRNGTTRIEMESDRDGTFRGVLPRDGKWLVDVAAEEPRLAARREVLVQAGRDGSAEIEIDLPDTRLFGRVVAAEEGRAVAGADVSLLSGGIFLPLVSDERGEFEARALPPGLVRLSADRGKAASGNVEVVVPGEGAVGPIELRLRRLKELAGTVVSSQGPVRGARIVIVPWRPELIPGDSVTTDFEGKFTAHLPEQAGTVLAVVEAPGYVLQGFEVPTDRPVVLRVADQGGRLEVSLPAGFGELAGKELTFVVLQDGRPLFDTSVLSWVRSHGGDVTEVMTGAARHLPGLAPGAYRACLVETARLAQWKQSGWSDGLATCAAGPLSAGETLRLDLGSK